MAPGRAVLWGGVGAPFGNCSPRHDLGVIHNRYAEEDRPRCWRAHVHRHRPNGPAVPSITAGVVLIPRPLFRARAPERSGSNHHGNRVKLLLLLLRRRRSSRSRCRRMRSRRRSFTCDRRRPTEALSFVDSQPRTGSPPFARGLTARSRALSCSTCP